MLLKDLTEVQPYLESSGLSLCRESLIFQMRTEEGDTVLLASESQVSMTWPFVSYFVFFLAR